MHEIVTSHPGYQAIQEEIAKLEAARRDWHERGRIAGEDYQAALVDHREATKTALLRGEEPPSEPELRSAGTPEEARVFLEEMNRLRHEEKELLARIAPEVEEEALTRERKLLEAARPHVEALADIREELADLLATTRHVRIQRERRIDGTAPGTGRSDRMRQSLAISDLVDAVTDDRSLLDPDIIPEPGIVAAGFKPDPKPVPLTRSRRDPL